MATLDPSKPQPGHAYTAEMRENFQAIADRLDALELLNYDDYDQPWTPVDASGANLTLTYPATNNISRRLNIILFVVAVTYPTNTDTNTAALAGLDTPPNDSAVYGAYLISSDLAAPVKLLIGPDPPYLNFQNATGTLLTNAELSGKTLYAAGWYHATI